MLVSVTERDAANLGERYPAGAATLSALERALQDAGLCKIQIRAVTAADIEEAGSAWAKRLGIPVRRPAWLLEARKPGGKVS